MKDSSLEYLLDKHFMNTDYSLERYGITHDKFISDVHDEIYTRLNDKLSEYDKIIKYKNKY